MTTKQQAWEQIIKKKNFDLTKKVNLITAEEIKKISKQEPRLMAKFDTYDELPLSFKEHGVFILPLKNKKYVLVKGIGFHPLEKFNDKRKTFSSRLPFELLSRSRGISEMQHIDYAYNSGLVEEFSNKGNLYLTIRGRKYSPPFQFRVDGSPILKAESVQVEVDAGFEGKRNVVIVEGKINTPSDFLIRQLYYPFRFWQTIIPEKQAIPIFFTFDPDTRLYNFWEYRFSDINDYESIELTRNATFQIVINKDAVFKAEDFADIRNKKEQKTIVPQADDVKKILEFPFLVSERMNNALDIARYFEFNPRQSSYYREATEALGLLKLNHGKYYLTDVGQVFIRLPVQERNELLTRLMFELPVMHEILMEVLIKPSKHISKEEIVNIIGSNSHLTGSTLQRRSQTILSWFRWIHKSVGVIKVEPTGLSI